MFEAILNIPEVFRIEIITEKRITKPPIITTVLIELVMLEANTSPKLEKVTLFFELLLLALLVTSSLSLNFQNLNKNPTIIQDKKCVINSNNPN